MVIALPFLLHTVAGSCPDIRRALWKKERVNKVGWVVELEGVGGSGDGDLVTSLTVKYSFWAAGLQLRKSYGVFSVREIELSFGTSEAVCSGVIPHSWTGGRLFEKKGPAPGDRDGLKMIALRTFVLLALSLTCQGELPPFPIQRIPFSFEPTWNTTCSVSDQTQPCGYMSWSESSFWKKSGLKYIQLQTYLYFFQCVKYL